jgi:hypothetical protein
VRRFFCSVRAKMKSESPMEAIETLASLWIAEHPEYFAELDDVDAAVARNYDAEPERTNPFLHLSMHLSISEQCSVDSPAASARPWNCWPASATCMTPTTR